MLTDSETAVGAQLVRRLSEEVINAGNLGVLDEIHTEPMARAARRWIEPFRRSFPDFSMQIVQVVAERDTVVGTLSLLGHPSGRVAGARPHQEALRTRRRDLLLRGP